VAEYELLKLDNQFCFPLYAASRLMTKMYQPLLEDLGITYPQYLILLILWEEKAATVMELGDKLLLSSNTLTPLLKRMEKKGILRRTRSEEDERKVRISLTDRGNRMQRIACSIPEKIMEKTGGSFSYERLLNLRDELKIFISAFKNL
jgi:MarR family transcriptional regulator, organic hydroperoxide resistance regulator